MALRIQKPVEPNTWLYQDRDENDRYFTDMVILGKYEPKWAECTQAEREQWEEEHKHEPKPEKKLEESVEQDY